MKLCKVFGILMIGLGVTCLSACGVENNTVQREYLQPSDESRYVEYIAEEVEIESDIIYTTAQSYDGQLKELGLDIYVPSEDECTARPAIIWVHGGGYTKGDKVNVFGVISISGDDLYHSFTRKAAPACLAVHGTADTTVDVKISEKFIKKLTQKGIEGETYLLKGLNHNLLTRYDEIRNQIGEFLYRQLTGVEKEITLVSDVNIEFRSVQSRLQNGWTKGGSAERATFGNLRLLDENNVSIK